MYSLPHWIAVIRLFGYHMLAMDKAREAIKPIADEFGKEPVANACEALVEIVPGKEPVARLKSHIKRMAFQILGAEQPAEAVTPIAPQAPAPDLAASSRRAHRTRRRKPEKPAQSKPSAEPPEEENHGQEPKLTSIMEQYRAAKAKHPDMVLLFRMGDFFEIFDSDAEIVHRILGLTLTTRDRVIRMCGFPHYQLEAYLHKLLKAGQRVAVCDPVESPARGPIKREITRVVTPGSMTEEKPVKQPRHFVLGKFQEWLNEQGHAFVAVEDVKRTTPDVAPHVGSLDFIVLRGEEKLLVTVRPNLQAKHLKAIAELQKLFGSEYKPMRIWPNEGNKKNWVWREYPVDVAATDS